MSNMLRVFFGRSIADFSLFAHVQNGDDEDEWVEEEDLSARAKAKLVSLKLCRNRCISHVKTKTAEENATPVVNLLLSILTKRGTYASLTDG